MFNTKKRGESLMGEVVHVLVDTVTILKDSLVTAHNKINELTLAINELNKRLELVEQTVDENAEAEAPDYFGWVFESCRDAYADFEEEEMQENCDEKFTTPKWTCLLYTSPSPRYQRGSRMPSSA